MYKVNHILYWSLCGNQSCEIYQIYRDACYFPNSRKEMKDLEVHILAQMFSCEFCKNFENIFSYRTPPVPASVSNI